MHVLFHRLSLCCFLLALGLLACGVEATKIPPLMVEVLQFNKTPMVPLRPLLDISGAAITVKGTAYTVTRGQHTFAFTLQSTAAQQDTKQVTLPLAPFLTGGVAYVPLEPLVTALGGSIALHEPEKAVEITLPECAPFTFMLDTPTAPLAQYRTGGYQLYAVNIDGSDLRRLSYTSYNSLGLPLFSPDGTKCVFTYKCNLYIRDIDKPQLQVLLPLGHNFASPAFSADGKQIACQIYSEVDYFHLCVVNVDGSGKRLYKDGGHPCFSPDGNTIAFESEVGGKHVVCIMNKDGSNVRQICEGSEPHFSPDGTVLVITKSLSRTSDERVLVIHHLSGPHAGETIAPQREAGVRPIERFGGFSTDGKEILFAKGDIKDGTLYWRGNYAANFDRSAVRQLEPAVISETVPAYSADGSRMVYLYDVLRSIDLKTGQKTILTPKMVVSEFELTPDGQQIIFVAQQQQ